MLKSIIEIQNSLSLSDYGFARQLGIARATWQLARTKHIPIGLTLLRAVSRTFPELDPQILQFLKEDHNGHK